MSIGTGIVLFVIGAILVWALNVEVDWVNLDVVGYILMAGGAVVFIVGLILLARRRRTDTVTRTAADPATGAPVTRRSVSSTDDDVI